MPRAKRYRMSAPVSRTRDEPYYDSAGVLLPCRRCGKNDGTLRGLVKTAVVLDNALVYDGDKTRWTITLQPGEDGDPAPLVKEAVLATENYHRECENAYARARRQSKSTRLTAQIANLENKVSQLSNELAQQRMATPQWTPPQPQRITKPPPVRTAPVYDPVYSRFQPPAPVDYAAYRIDPDSDRGSDASHMLMMIQHELDEIQTELDVFDKAMKTTINEDNESDLNAKRATITSRMQDALARQRHWYVKARAGANNNAPVSSSYPEQDNNP